LSNYKALLVDLDGTLYHAFWVRSAMAAELLLGHWPAIAVIRTFREEHERLRAAETDAAIHPFAEQVRRTAARLGCSPDHVENVVHDWMTHRPGKWLRIFRRRRLLSTIAQYHSGGGCTAIVSDYPARAKLQALRMAEHFDVVVANGEPDGPPRLKPWPDGYLLAAERLGVRPADCLVVGDRDDADGEAARRAGMQFCKI
jgi:beta-phosphoglucomutase-like phosphatase (HAD superfamily)